MAESAEVRDQLAELSARMADSEALLSVQRQLRDGFIAQMRSDGSSLREIASVAGVTPEMVRRLSETRTAAIRDLADRLEVPAADALQAALRAGILPKDWQALSQTTLDRLRAALTTS